jgi:Fe-S cluster biogenesis protein NfuA/nitrite reductase/ring-hydroxylating ferredoxin subunit
VDDVQARELAGHIEGLLDEAGDAATELVAALLELYGEGLARIVARVPDPGALAGDEVIAHLLLLHGLHPEPLATRVQSALDEVRPYLDSHGGDVELLGVEDGIVRLRLQGSCSGCPSSSATLKLAIEDAIHKLAPDVEDISAEGAVEPPPPAPGLLQLQMAGPEPKPLPMASWTVADGMPRIEGGLTVKEVAGERVLFVRLNTGAYAYRARCPGCGGSLEDAALEGAELACAGCEHRFDVRVAGRCVDDAGLHLDPVPLLVDGAGGVKVALGAPA